MSCSGATPEQQRLSQVQIEPSVVCPEGWGPGSRFMKLSAFARLFSSSFILLLAGCAGLGSGPAPTPTPTPASLTSLNHLVFFMQENRSFDHYFGQLNVYRAKQTPPLPQDVDTWTSGADKTPTNVSVPGFDPDTGQSGPPIKAYHMQRVCSENMSPSWNETHRSWNLNGSPQSANLPMNGFGVVQGHFAHVEFLLGQPNFTDFTGKRAMGYYDDT